MTHERESRRPLRLPIIALASVAALTLLWPPLVVRLLDADYMPHGHCFWWEPGLVGVHLVSDAFIALAYLSISLTLAYFVRKSRSELPFHWMFLAFGVFIIACGGTHLMEIVTLYVPVYWLSGYVKIVTALASVATAVALPPLIPKARAMLAAARASEERLEESKRANAALAAEVEERRAAEAALRDQIAYVRLLQTVASAANEEETIEPALLAGIKGVCQLAGWPIGRVLLETRDSDSLADAGIWYVDEASLGLTAQEARIAFASYVDQPNPASRLDADGAPHALEATRSQHPFEVASRLVFRMRAGKRVIGALEFQYVKGPHPDATLMDLVENVCAQLGRCVERHETERAMAERTAELRRQAELLDTTHDAIFVRGLDGTIRFWNRGAQLLYGWSPEEALGQTTRELLHTEFPTSEGEVIEALEHSGRWEGEIVHRTRDGRRLVVDSRWSLYASDGEDPVALELSTDVTARKEAENQLRAYAAQLQGSNRELQDFAFVASHDLQEPLRKIQALGDMLKDDLGPSLDPDALDYLERMQKAAKRMQALIRDLLEFSRISSRDQRFSSVDIAAIVADTLSDLDVRILESHAHLDTSDLPTIDADPLQMRQLFLNVIGNALKFARKDEPPRIEIRGRLGSPREGFCEILVKDNGVGFDEQYAEKIFNVFQRLHGRSAYEGTGIGLAICRRIVERHGGTIMARSTPGVGSEFVISLPVRRSESERV